MNLHTANNKFWESINDFVSGGGNAGFKCVTVYTTLTDESVTTVDAGEIAVSTLTYSNYIDEDEIVVTFNGTRYVCNKNSLEGGTYVGYGGWTEDGQHDFNAFPFAIVSTRAQDGGPSRNEVLTPAAGTYQIKIETEQETVETTPCFDKAVKSLANILTVKFSATADPAVYEGDKTLAEVREVVESGGLVLFIIPPIGTKSSRVDIVNFITGNQYITVQHTDNDTPRYGINGNVIEANFD